jgi:O-antigen ligase
VTTIIAMHGIGQVDTGEGWSGARTVQGGRITYLGFLNDPNDLAVAFLTALPLAIYLAREAASMLLRWASYGAAGTTLYGIYLTNSRGGFVALLAMLGVYCFHRFGLLRTIVVGPLALVPLLIMRPSRMEDVSPDEASASERVEAWYTGLQLFFEHPILGVGRGNFTEHHWLPAHNSYILVLAETGLAGYLIWTALIGTTLVALYRVETSLADGSASASPQSGPDAQHAAAARAMLYSLVGFLAAAFFLSRSYIPILYLVLGLSVAVYQIVRQRWPSFNPVRLLPMLGRLLVLQSASIVGLWMLVRVLLAMN